MNFDAPPRRQPPESIVPMINVVFLLLIFFLMTAEIAPPEPFEVAPPMSASGEAAEAKPTLYLDATGQLGFMDVLGDAALTALAKAYPPGGEEKVQLTLRADGAVPAADVARLLPKLAGLGYDTITLVTAPR